MKIDDEIDKLKGRIDSLENQNARFRKLLESAVDVTNSKTHLEKNENDFWQETIRIIEDEKKRVREDLSLLCDTDDDATLTVRRLQHDNMELQKKVEVLIQQLKKQDKELESLKNEHSEIKFLLTRPESNTKLFEDILKMEENVAVSSSGTIAEERQKLRQKISNFERKKNELFTAVEEIANPDSTRDATAAKIKADLETALFKAIDEIGKRELEALQLKVLDLEKDRLNLINELQRVVDGSRKKIADEYLRLQEKILSIEASTVQTVAAEEKPANVSRNDSEEKMKNILEAFSVNQGLTINKPGRMDLHSSVNKDFKVSVPTCAIL